jgi:hypothetical protein
MSKKNARTPSIAAPPARAKEELSKQRVAEPTAHDCDTVVSGGQIPVASSESAAKRADTEKTLLDYARTVGS